MEGSMGVGWHILMECMIVLTPNGQQAASASLARIPTSQSGSADEGGSIGALVSNYQFSSMKIVSLIDAD